MPRKNRTSVDREVTISSVTKFMAYAFGGMLTLAIITKTWPASGVVIAIGLCAALIFFNKRG